MMAHSSHQGMGRDTSGQRSSTAVSLFHLQTNDVQPKVIRAVLVDDTVLWSKDE
jgi:hypothetical protein